MIKMYLFQQLVNGEGGYGCVVYTSNTELCRQWEYLHLKSVVKIRLLFTGPKTPHQDNQAHVYTPHAGNNKICISKVSNEPSIETGPDRSGNDHLSASVLSVSQLVTLSTTQCHSADMVGLSCAVG